MKFLFSFFPAMTITASFYLCFFIVCSIVFLLKYFLPKSPATSPFIKETLNTAYRAFGLLFCENSLLKDFC